MGSKLGDVLKYNFTTPLASVQRANAYRGGGTRMRRVVNALTTGQPIKVVAIGGIATNGSAASLAGSNDYVALFAGYLIKAFPKSKVEVVRESAGIAPSSVVAACVDRYLPSDADLVLLEMTANDAVILEDSISGAQTPQAYEALVRKVLAGSKQPALLLTQSMVPGAGNAKTPFYLTPEAPQYAAVAGYYGVPTVSMRNALWDDGSVSPSGLLTTTAVLASDGSTPLDPGHKAIADALVFMVQHTAQDLVLLPFGDYDNQRLDGDLPSTPLYKQLMNNEDAILTSVTCTWLKNQSISSDCPGSASDMCGLDFSSKQALATTYKQGVGSGGKSSKQSVILGAIIGGVLGGIALIAGLLAYCIISRKRKQAAIEKARGLPTVRDVTGPSTSSEGVVQKPVGYEHNSSSVAVPISADTRH